MVSEFNKVLLAAKAEYEAGCTALAAKYVPQLYAAYRKETYQTPGVIAYEIYRATACMWRKDTVRRYLPAEAKNQIMSLRGKAGAKATADSSAGINPAGNCRRLATVTDSASGDKLTVPVDPDNSETYRDMRDGENLDLIQKLKEDHDHYRAELEILQARFDTARKKCTCGGYKAE